MPALSISRIWKLLTFAVIFAATLASCSPTYVLRAGWEEANILLKRRDLMELIQTQTTTPSIREKFQLVLRVRDFASRLGLEPKGSFLQYSEVNRSGEADHNALVWVLTASPKTSFSPVTWWFPIVGSVPYKGFFEKEDAISAAKDLASKNFDIYLRPSSAFSTLGWFNDPLLSTVVTFDEISLADTVIHEIVHNTIWVKDQAAFNETLANFIGAKGSRDFFLTQDDSGEGDELRGIRRAKLADARWSDELLFAHFLEDIVSQLEVLYAQYESSLNSTTSDNLQAPLENDILAKREKIFSDARLKWFTKNGEHGYDSQFRTNRYRELTLNLNNAILVAHLIYLTKPWLLEDLYVTCGNSLPTFIEAMKWVEKRTNDTKSDPFQEVIVETGHRRENRRVNANKRY